MAHSLSAKKRVRQNKRKRMINRARKSRLNTQIKKFEQALETGDAEVAKEQFRLTKKLLDKISSTSTMNKKTASRKKSRLAKKLNALTAQKS